MLKSAIKKQLELQNLAKSADFNSLKEYLNILSYIEFDSE